MTNCTLASNSATGGSGGRGQNPGFEGDSAGPASAASLVNTLLVANTPINGLTGAIINTNHNLWADNAAGIIGPLTNNGGPTLTMALPVGSPAIDAANTASAPSPDQRGAPRPVGAGADIGAYEAVAPNVVTPPQDCTVALFSTAQFSVLAAGAEPLLYQWFFDATNPLAGGPTPTLQLTNVQLAQAGPYTVVITNAYGALTSPAALLTVLPSPPTLTLCPASQTAWLGTSISFQAAAGGGPPLSFQWLFDATNALPGATNATLCLTNVQPAQAGGYSVVVTNTVGAVTSAVATLTLTPPVVTNSTEAALRAAVAAGGTVTFASSGTITLSGTVEITRDTVLDGTGQDVTISGGNAVRVFYVDAQVNLTLIHLNISDGRSDSGGGIYNAGTLTANLCSFSHNSAQGAPGQGGSTDPRRPQVNSTSGYPGYGGALFNASGATAAISGTTFDSNTAAGGAGGDGGEGGMLTDTSPPLVWGPAAGAAGAEGDGGAIYNIGYLILRNSVLTRNGAAGGAGGRAEGFSVSWGLGSVGAAGAQAGPGGASHGGAIFNSGQLTLLNCQCSDGTVAGGPGGEGDGSGGGGFSYGGALYNAGVARIDGSTCSGNTASGGAGGAGGAGNLSGVRGGDGGGGGSAYGGAVCNDGTASLVNSTLAGNTCAGGAGADGGPAGPAGEFIPPRGGNGGDGGNAVGGGISGPCFLTNCTLVANSALAGLGGAGGMGDPTDYSDNYGGDGSNGLATGEGGSGATMVNTLLVANSPFPNIASGLIDTNHNLWMNTNSNVVGPLADNGGPRLTMALLPGSPAIGAADPASARPTDQRGFPRPSGAADIGAYEFGYPPVLEVAQPPAGCVDISVTGRPGQSYWLLASPDLVNWTPVATNSFDPSGVFVFHDPARRRPNAEVLPRRDALNEGFNGHSDVKAVEHVPGNLQGVQLPRLNLQCAAPVGLADVCQVGERVRVVEGLP